MKNGLYKPKKCRKVKIMGNKKKRPIQSLKLFPIMNM